MTSRVAGISLVVAAMAVESLAQLFLKVGAAGGAACLRPPKRLHLPDIGRMTRPAPWVALGVAAYVAEVVLYTLALGRLDVSVACPLGSLCFVGVALLSRLFLGEPVGRVRSAGVALIILGSTLIAW